MSLREQRFAEIREHIKAESTQDIEALVKGMTSDCFNDIASVPKPFKGPKRVAERYRKHWAGFWTSKFALNGCSPSAMTLPDRRTTGVALI